MISKTPRFTLLPYTTLFRSAYDCDQVHATFGAFDQSGAAVGLTEDEMLAELHAGWRYLIHADPRIAAWVDAYQRDRNSTRLNSSHANISNFAFCLIEFGHLT